MITEKEMKLIDRHKCRICNKQFMIGDKVYQISSSQLINSGFYVMNLLKDSPQPPNDLFFKNSINFYKTIAFCPDCFKSIAGDEYMME